MATIIVTLSAAHLLRVVDALTVRRGYSATLENGSPNPQTKGEFVRQLIIHYLKDEVREHELAAVRSAVTVTEVAIT